MSIEKEYGKTKLVCDVCFEVIDVKDFDDAQYFMKEHYWKTKKQKDGEWVHWCSSCKFPI